MKKLVSLFAILLATYLVHAQKSASELVNDLNKIITLYSADNASTFRLLEVTGSLEQKIADANSQRIKLNDLNEVNLNVNKEANNVSIHCHDQIGCINIIKRDLSASPSPSTAFFFVDSKSASDFARIFIQLIEKFSPDRHAIKTNLPAETEPVVSSNQSEPPPPPPTKETKVPPPPPPVQKSNLEIDTDAYETEAKKPGRPRKEVSEDDEEEKAPKPVLRKQTKEVSEESEDEIDQKSKPSKQKKQAKEKDIESEETDASEPPVRASRAPMDTDKGDELVEPVCKQLMNIIQAGKRSGFKEIEGSLTNPEKKINESRAKLKGAKRCYLSWYKNQRAFIAEYKTYDDHEILIEEFLKLQTTLEDCLQGGWEDIDHSNDEMYANETEEVKDVEYKNVNDSTSPSFRIMMSNNSSKKQYILFVRIQ